MVKYWILIWRPLEEVWETPDGLWYNSEEEATRVFHNFNRTFSERELKLVKEVTEDD